MAWFGGKSRAAPIVWERFGTVRNYVEPFAGSLAVLLGRPQPFEGTETINDLDGYIANFWRSLQSDAEEVAYWADWPVNECDLHARHAWLVARKDSLAPRLEGDPDWHDAKIAGWWVWGISCWIGSGFCSGKGPWRVVAAEDGSRQLVHLGDAGQGVKRQLVHLGDAGKGVHRKLVHLGNAGQGVHRQLVHLSDAGQGVHRQLVHLGNAGKGAPVSGLVDWLAALSDRLRCVRVCCGDWSRVCGPAPTTRLGLTAVFLDPPYGAAADRDPKLYNCESLTVAGDCLKWCLERGGDPLMRIALCGYEGEGHEKLESAGWSVYGWKANGGYANQSDSAGKENARRERIWFSPNCIKPASLSTTHTLFESPCLIDK